MEKYARVSYVKQPDLTSVVETKMIVKKINKEVHRIDSEDVNSGHLYVVNSGSHNGHVKILALSDKIEDLRKGNSGKRVPLAARNKFTPVKNVIARKKLAAKLQKKTSGKGKKSEAEKEAARIRKAQEKDIAAVQRADDSVYADLNGMNAEESEGDTAKENNPKKRKKLPKPPPPSFQASGDNPAASDSSSRSSSPSPPHSPIIPRSPSPPHSPIIPRSPSPPHSPIIPRSPSPPHSPIIPQSPSVLSDTGPTLVEEVNDRVKKLERELKCLKRQLNNKEIQTNNAQAVAHVTHRNGQEKTPPVQHPPVNDVGQMEITEGFAMPMESYLLALNASTVRLRAARVMNVLFPKEERANLVVKKNSKRPNTTVITDEQYIKLKKICSKFQEFKKIDYTANDDIEAKYRLWVSEWLKNAKRSRTEH